MGRDSTSSQKQNLGILNDQVLGSTLGEDLFEVSPRYSTQSVLKTKALMLNNERGKGVQVGSSKKEES